MSLKRFPTILSKYHSYLSWHEPPSIQINLVNHGKIKISESTLHTFKLPTNALKEIANGLNCELLSED